MHQGNREWLAHAKRRHPKNFIGAHVLEIGSCNVNGTARRYFDASKKYVGVDQVEGPCVDVVSKAMDTVFEKEEFDTLVYLSVFEHDPQWNEGFIHNLQWVKPGGLIIVGWGAEGNEKHDPEPWAPVPVLDVLVKARDWPIQILAAFFEKEFFDPGCPGAFDLLALKK